MSVFYEITPLDTLFFRGSTPMEAGQNTAVSMFPPPISVFEGAMRTTVLMQNGIEPEEYASGRDSSMNEIIGKPGEKAPFDITCVMLKKKEKCYVPVPATWYLDAVKKPKEKKDYLGNNLVEAKVCQEDFDSMSVLSSEGNVAFSRGIKGLQPMGNIWITTDFLKSGKRQLENKDFLMPGEIFKTEDRTGIGLDSNKHTIKGQLYSAAHIRLMDDISLVVGISGDSGLKDCGKIQLGGEKRLCMYKKIEDNPLKGFCSSPYYLSVVPVEATEDNLKILIASSKLTLTAGWNMAKGFHKPSTSWIPAGAVFNKNINNMCIPLAHKGE